MRVRTLQVGADGKALVTLMTDPIPRHISIVNWGSNGLPAQSWRASEMLPAQAAIMLRETPHLSPDATTLKRNVDETCSALRVLIIDTMGLNITAAERKAQVTGFFAQAGARLAVIARSLGNQAIARAAASYRSAGIKRPDKPAEGTSFDSELGMRQFEKWLDDSLAYLADDTMRSFQEAEKQKSTDGLAETVLSICSWTGYDLAWYAGSMPDGQVGAKRSTRSAPESTTPSPTTEPSTMITAIELLKALRSLAQEEPGSFLELSVLATNEATKRGIQVKPTAAMRMAWGETGVQTEVPVENQLGLGNLNFEALVGKALAGIDFSVIPAGAAFVTTMRASIETELKKSLRAELVEAIIAELKDEKSAFTIATRAAVAPSVVTAMTEVLNRRGSGSTFFAPPETDPDDKADPWAAQLPGSR